MIDAFDIAPLTYGYDAIGEGIVTAFIVKDCLP